MTAGLERYFGVAGLTVVLTGATRGIGLAMTEAFAAAGARLVISSNEQDACHALATDLQARGVDALAVTADVRRRTDLNALIDAALRRFQRIDVLICNAGISGPIGSMEDAGEDVFNELLDVNLRHPLILSGRVAPLMAQQGGGSIIVTSSIAGLRGNARVGLYGITKAGLTQLARNLAVEYGPSRVRANAIAPGLIRTSWADSLLDSPQATATRLGSTPLRRVGEPWEIAAAALFLAGPGSAFITGQTLIVDGGTLISDGN
jgi:NAD(P)-dependent dehydrogenase (short-subunit alcohol dehydrogenase family)